MSQAVLYGLFLGSQRAAVLLAAQHNRGITGELSLEVHVVKLGFVLLERLIEMDLALHPLDLAAFLLGPDDQLGHIAAVDVLAVFEADLQQPALFLPLGHALAQEPRCQLYSRGLSAAVVSLVDVLQLLVLGSSQPVELRHVLAPHELVAAGSYKKQGDVHTAYAFQRLQRLYIEAVVFLDLGPEVV